MSIEDIALVPLSFAQLIQFFNELMTTRYMAVSGAVLLVYDWIITLDEEINDIWPAKLSVTKVVFLSNRYANIVAQIMLAIHITGLVETKTNVMCRIHIIGYGIEVFIALASIHVLVLMRAWVICNRRPWITISLALAYILYTAACVALIIFAVITAADKFIFNINGTCISFTAPTLWFVWVASLALEYVSFAFTFVSIKRNYTDENGLGGLRSLARKLLFSACVYILFSTLCHVLNMILWGVFWATPINMVAVTFTCCLMNLAGQRLVLDLRRFNRERIAHTMGSALPHIDSNSADLADVVDVVEYEPSPPPTPVRRPRNNLLRQASSLRPGLSAIRRIEFRGATGRYPLDEECIPRLKLQKVRNDELDSIPAPMTRISWKECSAF